MSRLFTPLLFTLLLLSTVTISSCSLLGEGTGSSTPTVKQKMDTVKVQQRQDYLSNPYQPAEARPMDLVHTKLRIEPDWQDEELKGEATLTITPHFYPQDSVVVDAHNFDLHKVMLKDSINNVEVSYRYDTQKLVVQLPETYHRTDTAKLFLDYTARLTNLKADNSVAGSKGMFFINADGKVPGKPKQIWTQGETEYSSHWFPTFDQPNQKTTQEVFITVDTAYQTLSNGKKIYTSRNPDGTRTDYWRQQQPHAPYLFMLAVGKYSKVQDSWHDSIPVNYYVEPAYEPYADMIFGETPEMMSYYSQLFDYPYPWAKYSQVAVRDFIAGAMENTTATIHFSGIQHNRREHQHRTYETLIAHELIHHWFGNLVTCESWANLAMNESFATYGEHLWMEHAHGDEAAAIQWQNDRRAYLREARRKQVPIVQYHYQSAGSLFDRHRYQKGACVLKMLRSTLGDEAFFQGISRYLHQHEYQPVEHHDLRLALEAVSGKDLKWFFDQWFRSPGHPVLDIRQVYDSAQQRVNLIVRQQQDTTTKPVYRLPLTVDVHHGGGKVTTHQVEVTDALDTLRFQAAERPQLLNFDAEKVLLAEKSFNYSNQAWQYQFNHTKSYLNQYEALAHLSDNLNALNAAEAKALTRKALNSPYRRIRQLGLSMVRDTAHPQLESAFAGKVRKLAQDDPETRVRGSAYLTLQDAENPGQFVRVFKKGLSDSSYYVVRQALSALSNVNQKLALKASKALKQTQNDRLLLDVARLHASQGQKAANSFLQDALLKRPNWRGRFNFFETYLGYLKRMGVSFFESELAELSDLEQWIADKDDRSSVVEALKSYRQDYQQELEELKAATDEKNEPIEQRERVIGRLNQMIETFQRPS